MRSFFITCLVFSLTLVVIIGNAVYINRSVSELENRLESIANEENDRADSLRELAQMWEKQKPFIQISVSHLKIDTVSELLSSLVVYGASADEIEFKKTTALLMRALEELRQTEQLTVVNIL